MAKAEGFNTAIVVINKPPNTKLVQEDILAERQGFTDEIGAALPKRVVEAFDMGCFACFFANGTMPFGG